MNRNEIRECLRRGDHSTAKDIAIRLQSSKDSDGALWVMAILAERQRNGAFFKALLNNDKLKTINDTNILIDIALAHYWTSGLYQASASLITAASRIKDHISRRANQVRALAEFVSSINIKDVSFVDAHLPQTLSFVFAEGFLLPMISVSLDGNQYPFIFDTGASTSVISTVVASQTQTYCRPDLPICSYDGNDKEVHIYPALIESLLIGTLPIKYVPVMVLSFPKNLNLQGLISPFDIFRTISVELDFVAGLAIIGTKTEPASHLIWEDGNMILEASVNGIHGFFIIDTGSPASFIYRDVAEKLGWNKKLATIIKGLAAAGESSYFSGIEVFIEAEEILGVNIKAIVQESSTNDDNPCAIRLIGKLGMDFICKAKFVVPSIYCNQTPDYLIGTG